MQSLSCQESFISEMPPVSEEIKLFPRSPSAGPVVHFQHSFPSVLGHMRQDNGGKKASSCSSFTILWSCVLHSHGDQQKGTFVGGLLEPQLCAQEGSLSLFIRALSNRWLLRTRLVGSLRCPPSVCSSSGPRQESLPSAQPPEPSALSSGSRKTIYGGMESILKLCSWRVLLDILCLCVISSFYSYSSHYFISLPYQFDFLLSSGKLLATIVLHKCFLTSIQELS